MEQALLKSTFVRSLLTTLLLWTGLSAYALKDGDNFTFEDVKYIVISEAEKTCRAVGVSAYKITELVLPSEPRGYKLVEISRKAFDNQRSLVSVNIPEGVSSIGESAFANCSSLASLTIPDGVNAIGKSAFYGCTSLASITIPKGITSIEEYTFYNCTSLTSVTVPHGVTFIKSDAFSHCTSLSTVSLPQNLQSIGWYAFSNCTSLSSVIVPQGLTEIGNYAFNNCSSLSSLILPQGLTEIGNYAFNNCSSLSSLILPQGLTEIGNYAFSHCSSLASLTIPEGVIAIGKAAFQSCTALASLAIAQGVASIGDEAFDGCSSLISLTIPKSVTSLGSGVFRGCTLKPLKFEGLYNQSPNSKLLQGLNDESEVCCQLYSLDALRHSGFKKVYPYDSKYEFVVDQGYYFKCRCNIIENPYCTTPCSDYKILVYCDDDEKLVSVLNIEEAGIYEVSDLRPDTKYSVMLSWIMDGKESTFTVPIKTSDLSADVEFKRTCTSITITAITFSNSLQGATVIEKGVVYNDIKHIINGGKKFIIDNLYPDETVMLKFYVLYSDGKNEYEYFNNRRVTTEKFSGSIQCQATPTTAILSGGLGNMSDITPDRMWWDIGSQKDVFNEETVKLISLDPESKTNVSFYFTYTPKGRETRQYAVNGEIKTPALELKTLQPKCVSESCAIVAASTNMSDDEVGAGFQWKKYDAPASLTPSSGSAVVCDGMLEGYIRNLQPTSYYNVRAYYKNAAGKYWYGDWVTFDPSDFSYFEPTVRTYPPEDITSSSAKVRGYALPGTDPFYSQGFQYWKTESSANRKIMRVESEITTVIATGQIMTATFEDLEPDTQYAFRVFVETEQGFTYGDEQTFTTDTDTGVYTINDSPNKADIIGYYNLMGVRSDVPHKGINIVIYSNGKTKKIYY